MGQGGGWEREGRGGRVRDWKLSRTLTQSFRPPFALCTHPLRRSRPCFSPLSPFPLARPALACCRSRPFLFARAARPACPQPQHFTCAKCEKPFVGAVFYEHQGLPFCEAHYNELTGDACGRCGRPSQGRSVNALNRHWCEGHFCCVGCDTDLAALDAPKFFERDSLPLCKNCYKSLPAPIQRKLNHYAEQERKVKADREKMAKKKASA